MNKINQFLFYTIDYYKGRALNPGLSFWFHEILLVSVKNYLPYQQHITDIGLAPTVTGTSFLSKTVYSATICFSCITSCGKDIHSIIHFSGNPHDQIPGMVFKISQKELEQADKYEVADYKRIRVNLLSGASAWVYVNIHSS
ncbi:gamma-glutamylcyclotransferase [Candidatus Dependentiae bacterium]|nr:gamma-glutamylcyclotransferase [Candidatus Dependentiae bacterium]